jgi:hypothetical protein
MKITIRYSIITSSSSRQYSSRPRGLNPGLAAFRAILIKRLVSANSTNQAFDYAFSCFQGKFIVEEKKWLLQNLFQLINQRTIEIPSCKKS